MVRFLLLQLIAHTISDFYLQTDKSCADKAKNGFKSPKLYIHALITFVCAWLLSFSFNFWWVALIIATTHLLVDAMKSYASNCKYIFFIDQIIHIVVIVAACYLWKGGLPECLCCLDEKYIALLLGVLVCIKPSNIIIKEIFKVANIKVSKGSEDNTGDLPNAGKLIGVVERLLSLVFVLLGQYEAVGFILAAKSILRFAEGDKAKSEYVLIGTLLSFSIAIFVGVAVKLYYGL
jgi:hypothetical protein